LVTNDNVATGRAVGEWVVSQLGGKGQVAVLNGPWGHQNALERRAGIFEGLATGDLALVASEPARWKRNLAADEVRRWRTQFPRLKAIIAANDAMALGARDAWDDVEDRPLITGVDGDPEAVSAVARGRIDLTVNRDAEQEGRLAVELMLRHLENQETFPPMVVVSDFELVGAGEDAP
jgi:ABC-type sugar transport system substrate-binding protein